MLTLVLVGLIGMVAGVLAATLSITPFSFQGEQGSYHSTQSFYTVTDNGLSVVANGGSSNLTTTSGSPQAFGATGTAIIQEGALTSGHWMESISFSTSLTDSTTRTIVITIRNGTTSPSGTTLLTQTVYMKDPASASTGTITVYLDVGASITTPITVYVSVT